MRGYRCVTNKKKKPQDDKKKHQEIGVVYCIPVDKIGGIGEVIILWHNEQKKKKHKFYSDDNRQRQVQGHDG